MTVHEDLRKAEQRPDDLIAAVLRDHAEIKQRFAEVHAASAADEKDAAFRRLVRKLAVHETAERELVHPLTKRADEGEAVVARRLEEETVAQKLLVDLEHADVSDPDFERRLQTIEEAVVRHAEAEERDEHPLLEQAVDARRLQQLAPVFRAAEAIGPTHPHPHAPASAVGTLAVGPIAAVMDRARDAIHAARSKMTS